jgi:cbb3-type cytochrome c oxidase subunit III
MPSYASLFDGSPEQPRQEARDLLAYLETLGRARELAWPEGDQAALAAAGDDRWLQMALTAPALNAHPGLTRPRGGAPALASSGDLVRGEALWRDYCAGCHGATGRGDGPAAAWLSPQPPDLSLREFTAARLADAFYNGVYGTAMPAWRDLPATDLAALATVVRAFSAVPATDPASPEQLAFGRDVFIAHCSSCHGEQGDGDGFAAGDLPIRPTDFRGRRASLAEVQRILRQGIEATSMAPWTDRLNEPELAAVAVYVRSLFIGDEP